MKIAVLFGSFNPLTNSHLAIMKTAFEKLNADKLFIVATNGQYLKRKTVKINDPFYLTDEERKEIIEKAVKNEDNLSFWGYELGGMIPSRFKTLCKIKKQYPDAEIYEIMGADKIRTLLKSTHGEEYVGGFKFAVFARNDIDVEEMGVAPFITGYTAGIPYKMYGTISAQPHKLMTNKENIKTIADITPENKISLVNIGSIQHIMLGMLCEQELGDAHALDNNLVAMAHPDGMAALLAGSVDCQLTTAPYIYEEAKTEGIHEVEGLEKVWPDGSTFTIGLVSNDCYENRPDVYEAIVAATQEAMDYINNNQQEAAAVLAEKQEVAAEDMLSWMQDPGCVYDMKLGGVMNTANFMAENGFIDEAPASFEDITTPSAR